MTYMLTDHEVMNLEGPQMPNLFSRIGNENSANL